MFIMARWAMVACALLTLASVYSMIANFAIRPNETVQEILLWFVPNMLQLIGRIILYFFFYSYMKKQIV